MTGLWGYLSAYQELVDQGLWERFSDLVVCSGSGGTSSALAIANYLTGSKIKSVHILSMSFLYLCIHNCVTLFCFGPTELKFSIPVSVYVLYMQTPYVSGIYSIAFWSMAGVKVPILASLIHMPTAYNIIVSHLPHCHCCRVHAVAIPVPGCVPIRDLENDMETLGLVGVAASDILDVIEDYEGVAYGVSDEDLESM